MKREGLAPPSHRQDQALALARDRLRGPVHGHVLLGMVGVAMARVAWAQLLDRFDIGQKLLADHLDRLAMQRKRSTFGFALQLVSARPGHALASRGSVTADTVHPDASGFHLRGFEACSRLPIEILEPIDAHRFHLFSLRSACLANCSTNMRSSQVWRKEVAE